MPIPRERTRGSAAYLDLKGRILEGRLPAGSPLREIEVAASLGASRTPAREALRRLEEEGLLTREANGGLLVTRHDQRAITELYAMREVLESAAARFAARNATEAEVDNLDAILREARAGGDPVALNHAFHQTIHGAAHNRFLLRALSSLTDTTYLLGRSTLADPARATRAIGEHAAIADAIRAADPERAERAAREHIRGALLERLKLLREAAAP